MPSMSAKTKPKTKKPTTRAASLLSEISGIEHQMKAEKRATEKSVRKVDSDCRRELNRLKARRAAAERLIRDTTAAGISLEKKRARTLDRLATAHSRQIKAGLRRISILDARLQALA